MNDEVRRLFHELADLPTIQRDRILAERRIAPDIRAEVISLLAFDSAEVKSFTACVAGAAGDMLQTASAGAQAQSCGPYRLVRLLGSGGMGTVYLAERADGEIEQRVAIKLLCAPSHRSGWRERFLRERQLLASLNHASIVHVIDAGHTEDGHPYLAMEYVDGSPIDVYAASLELRERVRLLLPVCDAVAHAHRHLIIHRDLKPSNILVDAAGRPKILDFGIAKLLDETGEPTETIDRLLTPNYASPEQMRGAAQTTATDIYSLGAVLYKLIAGRSPHESETRESHALEVVAGSREIAPLRRVDRTIPADLDCIVRKALRPEPEQRYASVEAFAADIRAFLEHRAVEARAGDVWYRTRKFLRKYWVPVVAAALVVASLSAGLYVANRERAIAQRRFEQVRKLAHTFVFDLHDQVAKLEGSTKVRETMVRTGLEYLDNLSANAENDLDLQREIATAYMKIGDAEGFPTHPNLGRIHDAVASYRKAGAIFERIAARDPAYLPDLAAFYLRYAGLVRFTHDLAQARALSASAIQTFDRVRAGRPFNADLETRYTEAWCTLGDMDEDLGQYGVALADFSRCLAQARSRLQKKKDTHALSSLSQAYERMATAEQELGHLPQALQALSNDEAELRELLAAEPLNPLYHRRLALVYQFRSRVYYDDTYPNFGDPARALASARQYLDAAQAMVHDDPNNTSALFSRAVAQYRVSYSLREFDPPAAVRMARNSVEDFDKLVAAGKANSLVIGSRVRAWQRLAEAELRAGRIADARRHAAMALAGQRTIVSQTAAWEPRIVLVQDLLLAARTSTPENAEALLREALAHGQQIAARRDPTSAAVLTRAEQVVAQVTSRAHGARRSRNRS